MLHTQSLRIAPQQQRILIVHLVRIVNSNRGFSSDSSTTCHVGLYGPDDGSKNRVLPQDLPRHLEDVHRL